MTNQTPIEQLKAIIEFRKTSTAPVDTMGITKIGEKNDEKTYRFQVLIGLMLSSRTKDEDTSNAIKNLQKGIEGGLTPATLSQANFETVDQLIKKVGFHKDKALWIIEAAKTCNRDYDNDIPHTLDELKQLKGVGMKMATLCMAHAWNEQVGIGVDVHVHRISNLLKWVKTSNPDKTETELEKVFPKELWKPLNKALVGFGQTICGAKKQKCDLCPISDSCPHFNDVDSDSDSNSDVDNKKSSHKVKRKRSSSKSVYKRRSKNKVKDNFEDSDIEDFVFDDESESTNSESDLPE